MYEKWKNDCKHADKIKRTTFFIIHYLKYIVNSTRFLNKLDLSADILNAMENQPSAKKVIEIQPMGSYFELDADGYVINPASLEKVQPKWKPVIDEVVEAYKTQYGDKLKNIYIRGSVAKGQAVDNVSDIDTLAYVDLPEEEIEDNWTNNVEDTLKAKFPFVEGFELGATPFSEIKDASTLLNQSICVYGEPVQVPKMKPGKEMMRHLPYVKKRMQGFDRRIQKASTEEKIQAACTWVMKDLLRAAFELTMERSNRYTRDLYLCYEGFSEYYPEKEAEVRKILHYALNPTSNKEEIITIKESFSSWLLAESKNYT